MTNRETDIQIAADCLRDARRAAAEHEANNTYTDPDPTHTDLWGRIDGYESVILQSVILQSAPMNEIDRQIQVTVFAERLGCLCAVEGAHNLEAELLGFAERIVTSYETVTGVVRAEVFGPGYADAP